MSYLLAILLPGVAVILKGRVLTGLGLLLLQVTIIGWIPAVIAAMAIINNTNTQRTIKRQFSQLEKQH